MSEANASFSTSPISNHEKEEPEINLRQTHHQDLPEYWNAPPMDHTVPLSVLPQTSFIHDKRRRGVRISWVQYVGLWSAICFLSMMVFIWVTVALHRSDPGLFGTGLGIQHPIAMANYVRPAQPINFNPHIVIGAASPDMIVSNTVFADQLPTAVPAIGDATVEMTISTSQVRLTSISR
jgi:hypothetical protein